MSASQDTSRISITAHHTGYTWYANNLSHPALATAYGKAFYYSSKPWMHLARTVLGLADLETALLQRHMIIDHLLDEAFEKHGSVQVLELASGLSPRGFRFCNKHSGKDVLYIEADLPGMAGRKKTILENHGLMDANHFVLPCNILVQSGELSLEGIFRDRLDHSKPVFIITEGIINYFDLETMRNLWIRMAGLLKNASKGIYVSDNMPRPVGHSMGFFLTIWNQIVATIARGGFYMHFSSDGEAENEFKACGFESSMIHRPESFKGVIPIPASRRASFLRVIQAET